MDKISDLAGDMGLRISEIIKSTDRYKEYQRARSAIFADKNLHNKVNNFLEKHTRFLYAMRDGTATFDQERYMSQEFHKLMLNKNVNIYIESGLYFVELLAELFEKSVEGIEIDLDI
ncbi:MAG: YlbF family regulator [Firmicutes bacterium]|nr:YlbF family regulator [Bacillota bacterium]